MLYNYTRANFIPLCKLMKANNAFAVIAIFGTYLAGCAKPGSTQNNVGRAANPFSSQAAAATMYHGHGTGGILDRPTRSEFMIMSARLGQLANPVQPYRPRSTDGTHNATKSDPDFSWRKSNVVPLPTSTNDQSRAGFCYVFAPIAALESSWEISHPGESIMASEQHVANCTDGDGVRGGKASHAIRYLVEFGTTSSSKEPYLTSPTSQPSADFKVSCHHIESSWPIYQGDATDFVANDGGLPTTDAMKQAIIDHGPIVSFIYAGGTFGEFFIKPNADTTVITDNSTEGPHFILITGWDDNKSYENGKGAWEVRNSWGPDFGAGGFVWVKYGIRDITDNAMWIHAK